MQIPDPLDDVSAGKLQAVSLPPIVGRELTPQSEFVVTHFHNLGQFNLGYHEFADQGISVIYNPKLTSEKSIAEAHAKGDLFQVAPLVAPPKAPASAVVAPAAAPAAPAPAAAPAGSELSAPAAAPAVTPGSLATSKVPTNKRVQSARLQNDKSPGINEPNPVVDQLAKRAL